MEQMGIKETFMKNLYIWGAGDIGKRIFNHLPADWEIVFVDSNKNLLGSAYCGKRVISVEEYLQRHFNEFILIGHLYENESIQILKSNNVCNYFIHCDLPGEFREPCTRENLKKFVIKYLNYRKNYVLYGLSLYSIIIDDWIYENFRYHPYILVQDNISKEFVDKIEQQYKDLRLINSIRYKSNIDEICVCLHNYDKLYKLGVFAEFQMTDIFDCSDKISDYQNPLIKKFRDLHKGKRCFIVATGPSLKIEDLNLLKGNGEICISMNSIYHAFSRTEWRPDYYVMSDHRGFCEYQDLLDSLPVRQKFLSDNSDTFWSVPHKNNIFRYHQHYEYCCDRFPKFSDDFSVRSYTGATVTYTCMQLAVYMGFKEIYLLGVDFTYDQQERNIKYTYFYNTDGSNDLGIGYVRHVTLAYQAAKQYADTHGIKIYNATRGGKLKIYERVDFERIIRDNKI